MEDVSRLGICLKALSSGIFILLLAWSVPVFAEEGTTEQPNAFHLGGYVRTWAQMNLQDEKQTKENDRWDFSMLRGSILLDAEQKIDKTPIGPVSFKVIARLDREIMTNYLRRLQDISRSGAQILGGTGGPGDNMKEEIYDQAQIREWYVDLEPFERLQLRIGKQQVVWGETDFFRAMDIVHGYDFRWRFFMEPENEEVRKPLIMVNARIQVPELAGSLQLLLRPGFDRDADVGNTYDVNGGRYSLTGVKGLTFNSYFKNGIASASAVAGITTNIGGVNYLVAPGTKAVGENKRHPDGDVSEPTYGVRWSGAAGPVGYSLAYLKTFSNDPVASTTKLLGGTPLNGVDPISNGSLVETVYPKIDVFGLTMNGYVPLLDAVLSTELVFTRDQPYNASNGYADIAYPSLEMLLGFPAPYNNYNFFIPSTNGGSIVKKNVLKTMLRMDKTIAITQQLLGTGKPCFFSVQMFDEWILAFRKRDNIIDLLTFGAPQREHTTLLTAIALLSYRNETINPMLAFGWDMSYQGTFFFPSVEFVLGNHWRARLEANFFFGQHQVPAQTAFLPPAGNPGADPRFPGGLNQRQPEYAAHMLDYFANNDQLLFRLTYQF
ncbi:MAG: DUF1302 family protein [Geobacteraceae bacterium]